MYLKIDFPENLLVQVLLEQKNIPCFCSIDRVFHIGFQDPLPDVCGVVEEWDQKIIDERAPAGAGGRCTHFCFGTVSLEKVEDKVYRILDLSFFNRSVGWCPIVENAVLLPPGTWGVGEDW